MERHSVCGSHGMLPDPKMDISLSIVAFLNVRVSYDTVVVTSLQIRRPTDQTGVRRGNGIEHLAA